VPWECRSCNEQVANDADPVCPACKTSKADWTLARDKTRNFVVPSRKSEMLIGWSSKPLNSAGSYTDGRPIDRAPSVPAVKALKWHADGQFPPPDCVLLVRMWVGAETSLKLGLAIEWEGKKAEDLPLMEFKAIKTTPSAKDPTKKRFDARFLFVHGATPWPKDKKWAGMTVLDVSEAGAKDGHASRVGFKPFNQAKRIAIHLDALKKGWAERLQCYELEFNHDSHMMKPDGLDVIWEVLQRCSMPAYKDKRLLIAGHTDSSGDEKTVNMPLARRRCENIIHLLTDDRDAWAASACDSYTRLAGRDKKKAELDKDLIEASFPSAAARVGDWSSPAGWKVIYDAYDAELLRRGAEYEFTEAENLAVARLATEELRKKERARLQKEFEKKKLADLKKLRDAIQWVDPDRKAVPCGERFLRVKTDSDEKKERNRRDEFLWFPTDKLPWNKDDAATRPKTDEEAQNLIYGTATQAEWDYNTYDGPYTFDQLLCPEDPVIPVPPNQAVFVIDCSGSMRAPLRGGGGISRIVACRRALQRVIRRIPAGNEFAMYWFDNNVGFWRTGQLVKANQTTLDEACLWVATLPLGGSTDTWSALEAALKVTNVKRILLLSDGVPTDRVTNEPAVLQKVRDANAGRTTPVPIDTYGFLAVPDPLDETERAIVQKDRDTVGAEYTTQMATVPEGQDVTPDAVLPARYAAVTKALNDRNVNTARGNNWTQTYVGNLLLGWFLDRLSKDTGGGPFVDLTSRIP
jgi:outer membrane protein OmpA-like peptidoglycan-associated protein